MANGFSVRATGSFSQSSCSLAGPMCAGNRRGKNHDGSQAVNFGGGTVSDAQRVTISTVLIPQRSLIGHLRQRKAHRDLQLA